MADEARLSSGAPGLILDPVQPGVGMTRTSARPRRHHPTLVAMTVALLLTGAASVSWAHMAAPPSVLAAAPAADPDDTHRAADSLLLLVLAVAGALAASRSRRFALGLVVLLVVLGFEAGLHAAHHLDDPARAAGCAVAATLTHLTGSPIEGVAADVVMLCAPYPILPGLPAPVAQRPHAPHAGRAPPVPVT